MAYSCSSVNAIVIGIRVGIRVKVKVKVKVGVKVVYTFSTAVRPIKCS